LLRPRPRWGERFGGNELFDRHLSEGGEGFDLPMLLRLDFDGESVHTPQIVKIPTVGNRWFVGTFAKFCSTETLIERPHRIREL
jgi:hypothetical protein